MSAQPDLDLPNTVLPHKMTTPYTGLEQKVEGTSTLKARAWDYNSVLQCVWLDMISSHI